MSDRKGYDRQLGETEATTYMRDVVDCALRLLQGPNTGCADLFSHAIVEKAVAQMNASGELARGAAVSVPTPAELRKRIFALFHLLHFRIHRRIHEGYARYGVDKGLRADDKPVHHSFAKMRTDRQLRPFHKELLA